MEKTKHSPTCAMVFGRKDPTCARCVELMNGATPRAGWNDARKRADAQRSRAIAQHDFVACAAKHVVCTCFDW
jgi:hypothetical protein